ncbi:plasmid pRiA4b ORF-3 family protein [Bacillus xiapuensis]|uniref:Plasmid pRiA4b ORF-3 family protein n=1 Tax=Bacillus xiapuensis TaxID=2014075 RepID=A0ABU6ND68_9BACI|nr:plasmid pRiA4b ORF-3 family protein [Bacillus xiapuensis]
MILQLKVTLKNTKPPVWRRLQVHSNTTFQQPHHILQATFDWSDYHLHCFEIRRTNQETIRSNYPTIGPLDQDNDLDNYDYNENNVKLNDWLKVEKDKVVYIYDFGDDWQHEIVLEKILSPESGISYPRCIKVMREAPEEDSGGFDEVNESFDNTEIMERINTRLSDDSPELTESQYSHWPELLALANEFKALQPWKWVDDDQIFAVEDPSSGEYVFCSVMGGGGVEFGIAAFIGHDGLKYLNKLNNQEIDESTYLEQRSLLLSFNDRSDLTSEDLDLLKAHGLSYRGKRQWPQFRSFKPGYLPWMLDEEEVKLFVTVLKQAIEVCKLALNDHELLSWKLDTFFTRMLNEDSRVWENSEVELIYSEDKRDIPPLVDQLELQRARKISKRFNVPIEFDVSFGPTPIQENSGERPYFPHLVLCLERHRGLIIYQEFLRNDQKDAAIQQSLLSLIQNLNAIPRELWIKEELQPILQQLASKLRINLIGVKNLRYLEEARREMFAHFRSI